MDQRTEREGSNGELTPEQLAILRDRLQAMRARLLARRSSDQDVVRADGDRPIEPMEAAMRTGDEDDVILAVDRERALLVDVEDALAKLSGGHYGFSEASGASIGFPRLQAVPWARLTADEEEVEEEDSGTGHRGSGY
jgi:DnaK suppressor protein